MKKLHGIIVKKDGVKFEVIGFLNIKPKMSKVDYMLHVLYIKISFALSLKFNLDASLDQTGVEPN